MDTFLFPYDIFNKILLEQAPINLLANVSSLNKLSLKSFKKKPPKGHQNYYQKEFISEQEFNTQKDLL